MKWLTKIGQNIAKYVGIATGLLPLLPLNPKAASTVTKVTDTLTTVAEQIVTVEAVFVAVNDPTKKGADKLRAATPLVAQVILNADLMTGKNVRDQIMFLGGCQQVASGMADILNSLEDAKPE